MKLHWKLAPHLNEISQKGGGRKPGIHRESLSFSPCHLYMWLLNGKPFVWLPLPTLAWLYIWSLYHNRIKIIKIYNGCEELNIGRQHGKSAPAILVSTTVGKGGTDDKFHVFQREGWKDLQCPCVVLDNNKVVVP